MSKTDINQAKDPILRASYAALQRAALLAREEAIRTHTHLVIVQNGQVVRIPPEQLRSAQPEDADQ